MQHNPRAQSVFGGVNRYARLKEKAFGNTQKNEKRLLTKGRARRMRNVKRGREMVSFARQLNAVRKKHGITQDQLAQALNISRTTVSRWETGRILPDIETIKLLCKVLDYNFFSVNEISNEETVRESEGEEAQMQTAAEEPEEIPKKKIFGKKLLFILGAVLLVTVLIFVLLRIAFPKGNPPIQAPSENKVEITQSKGIQLIKEPLEGEHYSKAWYLKPDEKLPGQPYVTVTPLENPVMLTANPENTSGICWIYYFDICEQNGIAFTIDNVRVTQFLEDKKVAVQDFSVKSENRSYILSDGNSIEFNGGFPYQGISAVGLLVSGHDEKGNALEFHGYVELSDENLSELKKNMG